MQSVIKPLGICVEHMFTTDLTIIRDMLSALLNLCTNMHDKKGLLEVH